MSSDRSLSRRAFLSGIAASSAAAILAACGSSDKTPTPGSAQPTAAGAQPTAAGASPATTGGAPTI
ncbi:MAG: twin-arginine translocation signal domain-containing protein, partial [Thermomicrobiales bacterium]